MNLLHMQQFQVIAKHESIALAAEELFVSSAALSKTLRLIENEFNCLLFDRIGRKIYLNQHGAAMLQYINEILKSYDKMQNHFSANSNQLHASIVLCDLGENILDKSINTFLQKYPYIQVKKESASFEKSVELLLKKEVDIIFTDHLSLSKYESAFVASRDEIIRIFLFRNNLFLAVPPDSKYAHAKDIDLKQIQNEAFVSIKGELPCLVKTAPFIEYVCETEKVQLNFAHHYNLDYAYKHLFFTPHLYT